MIALLLALIASGKDAKVVRIACPAPGDVAVYQISTLVACDDGRADPVCSAHVNDVTFQVTDAGGARAHRVVWGPASSLLPPSPTDSLAMEALAAQVPLDLVVTTGPAPAVVDTLPLTESARDMMIRARPAIEAAEGLRTEDAWQARLAGATAAGPLVVATLDEVSAAGLLACSTPALGTSDFTDTGLTAAALAVPLGGTRTIARERGGRVRYVERTVALPPADASRVVEVLVGPDGWPELWSVVRSEDAGGGRTRTVTIEAHRMER